jgi:hypothetical protein
MRTPSGKSAVLFPTDPSYPTGAHRAWSRLYYARLVKDYGTDALPTRAALGRMLYHGGEGFQKSIPLEGVEVVAWQRESGTQPGYMNRAYRKHMSK